MAHQGRYDIPEGREGEVDLRSLLEALTLGKERTYTSTSTLSLFVDSNPIS